MEPAALFDEDLQPLPTLTGQATRVDQSRAVSPPVARRPRQPARPLLLAVDGNALAHRAFHAYGSEGMASGAGGDRSALYGFVALLAAVVDRAGPAGILIAFDCRERSWRRQRWPAYKAQRPAKDPALHALFDLLAALLADLGVAVVTHPGCEADDSCASAAATAEAAGWDCVVATSDKDAFVLVSPATTVLRLRSGIDRAEEVTPAVLRRLVGVDAGQYLELSALRGDPSDNLPGVPGIGPARAAALLRVYPDVASAAADPLGCRSVLGPGPGQALLDDLADPAASRFLRNVELMRLATDLPVDLDATAARLAPEAVAAVLGDWGLGALAGRAAVAFATRPERPAPPGCAATG